MHARAAGVPAMNRVWLLPVLLAGIGGGVGLERVFLARRIPDKPALSAGRPVAVHDKCAAERAEIVSTRAQLSVCVGLHNAVPTAELEEAARVQDDIEVMRTHTEVVIVRHSDHTTRVYPVGEPIEDGIIVARRLPTGEMAWYAGSGSRDDPASFKVPEPGSALAPPVIERAPDGTLMVNGQPGSPALQRMFPGTKKAP